MLRLHSRAVSEAHDQVRLYAFLADSTIRLGPLVLSTSLLYILLGVGAGSVSMFVLTKNDKHSRKSASDLITNFFLIVILTWKLLPIVLAPGDIIANPLMILYASGGAVGVATGAVLGTGYLVFKLFISGKNVDDGTPIVRAKNLLPLRGVFKPVLIFFVTAAVVSSFLFVVSGVARNGNGGDTRWGDRPVARTVVGSVAPDFELFDTDGDLVNFSDYRGKWVILNFWATWCPPCLAEIPTLIKFYDKADKDNVVLLGINATGTEKSAGGDARSYVSTFVKEKGINFPVLLDICDGAGLCVSAVYGAGNLPTTVVISPEGIVTRIKTGVVDSFWLRVAVSGD